MCLIAAPGVFRSQDSDGHSYAIDGYVAPADEPEVRNAAAICPEGAIEVTND
jgi:ferredoxin